MLVHPIPWTVQKRDGYFHFGRKKLRHRWRILNGERKTARREFSQRDRDRVLGRKAAVFVDHDEIMMRHFVASEPRARHIVRRRRPAGDDCDFMAGPGPLS